MWSQSPLSSVRKEGFIPLLRKIMEQCLYLNEKVFIGWLLSPDKTWLLTTAALQTIRPLWVNWDPWVLGQSCYLLTPSGPVEFRWIRAASLETWSSLGHKLHSLFMMIQQKNKKHFQTLTLKLCFKNRTEFQLSVFVEQILFWLVAWI